MQSPLSYSCSVWLAGWACLRACVACGVCSQKQNPTPSTAIFFASLKHENRSGRAIVYERAGYLCSHHGNQSCSEESLGRCFRSREPPEQGKRRRVSGPTSLGPAELLSNIPYKIESCPSAIFW